jgi:hypothetical protein
MGPVARANPLLDEQTPATLRPRAERSDHQTPTIPLSRVEIEAILHSVDTKDEAPVEVAATRTVASVRIALVRQTRPPSPPAMSVEERGPRRPREILSASQVKIDPDAPTPILRKR